MSSTAAGDRGSKSRQTKRTADAPKPAGAAFNSLPERFTYALAQHTVERRATGWFFARSQPSFADGKIEWFGPYKHIENVALAIARRNATEIADRHTRSIEHHGINNKHALYGLKPTTVL